MKDLQTQIDEAWAKAQKDNDRKFYEFLWKPEKKGEMMALQPEIKKTEEGYDLRETTPKELVEAINKSADFYGDPIIRLSMKFLHKQAKEPYKSKRAIACTVYDPGMPFEIVGSGLVQVYKDHVFLTFGELSTAIILPRANLEKHFDPAKKSHKLTNITEGEEDGGIGDSGQKEQDDSGKGDEANVEDNLSGGGGCK